MKKLPMVDSEFETWLAAFQSWLEVASEENAEWVRACRSRTAEQSRLAISPEEVAALVDALNALDEGPE